MCGVYDSKANINIADRGSMDQFNERCCLLGVSPVPKVARLFEKELTHLIAGHVAFAVGILHYILGVDIYYTCEFSNEINPILRNDIECYCGMYKRLPILSEESLSYDYMMWLMNDVSWLAKVSMMFNSVDYENAIVITYDREPDILFNVSEVLSRCLGLHVADDEQLSWLDGARDADNLKQYMKIYTVPLMSVDIANNNIQTLTAVGKQMFSMCTHEQLYKYIYAVTSYLKIGMKYFDMAEYFVGSNGVGKNGMDVTKNAELKELLDSLDSCNDRWLIKAVERWQ